MMALADLFDPEVCEAAIASAEAMRAAHPAPPPPWAGDAAMTAGIRHILRDLDLAGGWVKPDPLLDGDRLPNTPDFYTEARRDGWTPEGPRMPDATA